MVRCPYQFLIVVVAFLATRVTLYAQGSVTASLSLPATETRHSDSAPNAVLWLEPVSADLSNIPWPAHQPYRLVQKNRTFSPHILVVPQGTAVAFPNQDPFFHNVFSLFDGSRFDLGLYEAGTTRNVRFARKGISYIFCNIHPEMSAIVVALDTPLWKQSHDAGRLTISNVPAGSYQVNLWVEGQDISQLAQWKHQVVVTSGNTDVGKFLLQPTRPSTHTDKFGHDYKKEPRSY